MEYIELIKKTVKEKLAPEDFIKLKQEFENGKIKLAELDKGIAELISAYRKKLGHFERYSSLRPRDSEERAIDEAIWTRNKFDEQYAAIREKYFWANIDFCNHLMVPINSKSYGEYHKFECGCIRCALTSFPDLNYINIDSKHANEPSDLDRLMSFKRTLFEIYNIDSKKYYYTEEKEKEYNRLKKERMGAIWILYGSEAIRNGLIKDINVIDINIARQMYGSIIMQQPDASKETIIDQMVKTYKIG